MSERQGWFIRLFGSLFAAVFVWVIVILIVYRWFDKPYFPDWNALFSGYSASLKAHNITLDFFKDSVQWCYDQLMDAMTFGHFGKSGWLASLFYGWNLLSGGVLAFVYGLLLIAAGGMYLVMLLTGMLSMVGFVLGAQNESHSLMGLKGVVQYATDSLGYGDSYIDWWSWYQSQVASVSS